MCFRGAVKIATFKYIFLNYTNPSSMMHELYVEE